MAPLLTTSPPCRAEVDITDTFNPSHGLHNRSQSSFTRNIISLPVLPRLDSGTTDNANVEDTETEGAHWAACLDIMKVSDEKMITNWNAEIDGLLLFAALFSAVVTTFVVDSYKSLQPDPSQVSTQILSQISLQLSSMSINDGPINPRHPPYEAAQPAGPSTAIIRINILWFTSLVLSLTAALFGIFSRQWMRAYVLQDRTSPHDSVRTRQFFYDGLASWRVPSLMTFLPVLLQASVVIFLVGLVDMLWTLNSIVASAITVVVALPVTASIVIAVLPVFTSESPFVSPLSSVLRYIIWAILWTSSFVVSCSMLSFRIIKALFWSRRDFGASSLPYALRYIANRFLGAARVHADRHTRRILPSSSVPWALRAVPPDAEPGALDARAVEWLYGSRSQLDASVADPLILACFRTLPANFKEDVLLNLAAAEHDATRSAFVHAIDQSRAPGPRFLSTPHAPPKSRGGLLLSMLNAALGEHDALRRKAVLWRLDVLLHSRMEFARRDWPTPVPADSHFIGSGNAAVDEILGTVEAGVYFWPP